MLPSLEIHPGGTHFRSAGRPVFLLADTLWAAFGRTSLPEWAAYLRQRRRQGFNAVNVSVLPIPHDETVSGDALRPFEGGDPQRPSPGYFHRAGQMVAMARAEGLTPLLVVLWCNYVPGTWGAARTPGAVLTPRQADTYLDLVLETFAPHRPVFAVSGDERFDAPEAVATYARALHRIRAGAPGCLVTAHTTPDAVLPAVLTGRDGIDFVSYQSGHDAGWLARAADLAAGHVTRHPRRPVVNLEPCYEGHLAGPVLGRHRADAVRAASWSSVLAGAGAGLGYGAHGVWSWHRPGERFVGEAFSGTPFPADAALGFPGAVDAGLLRRIVQRHRLYDLRARQDLVTGPPVPVSAPVPGSAPEAGRWVAGSTAGVRFGMSPAGDRAAAYLRYPVALRLGVPFAGAEVTCWNLARRRTAPVPVHCGPDGTTVEQPADLADWLYVFERR